MAASLLLSKPEAIKSYSKRMLEEEYMQSKMPLNPNNLKHLDAFDHQLAKIAKFELQNNITQYSDQIADQILARCLIDAVLVAKR